MTTRALGTVLHESPAAENTFGHSGFCEETPTTTASSFPGLTNQRAGTETLSSDLQYRLNLPSLLPVKVSSQRNSKTLRTAVRKFLELTTLPLVFIQAIIHLAHLGHHVQTVLVETQISAS